MPSDFNMNIEVINTGSELLIGQVVNTNVGHIGQRLSSIGLSINRQISVPDGDVIKNVLAESIDRSDIVIVTGGLGPTHDDVSKEMLSELLNLELYEDDLIVEKIRTRIESNGTKMRQINTKQALVPTGGIPLENDNGTAPGIYLNTNYKNKEVHIFLLPGPPKELLPIYDNSVEPILKSLLNKSSLKVPSCINLFFSGLGESELSTRVTEITSNIKNNVEFGYCLKPGGIILRCTGDESIVTEISNKIIKELEMYYLGDGIDSLPLSVVHALSKKDRTLAVAESCTGGYLTSLLTDVPGSSNVFNVGYITYSNHFKKELLNVSSDLLNNHGAVSPEVATAMAEGCLNQSNASYALAITGIAGPGGGSVDKPVGTVYISLASKFNETLVEKKIYQTSRFLFKEKVAMYALNLVRESLLSS